MTEKLLSDTFLPVLLCLIILPESPLSSAAFISIPGCPNLNDFLPKIEQNETLPPCFCDNATSDAEPPVFVNCLGNPTFDNLTTTLLSVQKSGKRLAAVNAEYMTFDNDVAIPDNYFKKFGLTPEEITIVGCQNDRLPLNYTFSGLEKSLKKLTIIGCTMLRVPPSIAGLESLEFLMLQDTAIGTIFKDDFRGLKNLKHLDLVGNQVYHIENGAFDNLSNVETAILGPRNSLNSSAIGELNKLVSAKTLILHNNAIEELPDNSLNALSKLQTLDLATNNVENITVNSFAGLTNLRTLNLSLNLLKRIEDGSFRDLNNLHNLRMDANFLEDIGTDTFQGLNSLEQLNLDWNEFYVIDKETFAAMPRLKSLSIVGDQNLEYVDSDAFDGLKNLQMLNISYSNISTFDPRLLRPIGMTLENLDVSGCKFERLDSDTFTYGANIQNLSLAGIPVIGLPVGIFSPLMNLRYLNLSNIQWICDDKLAWLISWLKEQTSRSNFTLVNSSTTSCWEPLELRNNLLTSVDPSTLRPYEPLQDIQQPSTPSTAPWTSLTSFDNSRNDTNNSSDLSGVWSANTTIATTEKVPAFGDPLRMTTPQTTENSRKIKIIIAIVASVVSVATIAVIAIVIAITRKRRRKQNQDKAQKKPTTRENGRPTSDETEMATTRVNGTSGTLKNGGASQSHTDTGHEPSTDTNRTRDAGKDTGKIHSATAPQRSTTYEEV